MLLQLAEAERELGDLREGRRGAVAVGAVSGPAFDFMPAAVLRVREIAPEIELSVKIDSSNVLARDLLGGRLDFLLARVPDDLDADDFDAFAIGVEEARLVVRRGHPLLARAPARLADLAGCEWVMQPRGTPLRRALDSLFLAANLPPPRRLVATTSLTMTMMTVAQVRRDRGAQPRGRALRLRRSGAGGADLAGDRLSAGRAALQPHLGAQAAAVAGGAHGLRGDPRPGGGERRTARAALSSPRQRFTTDDGDGLTIVAGEREGAACRRARTTSS